MQIILGQRSANDGAEWSGVATHSSAPPSIASSGTRSACIDESRRASAAGWETANRLTTGTNGLGSQSAAIGWPRFEEVANVLIFRASVEARRGG